PSTFAARGPHTTAPTGTPEPRPLARGITSGLMPAHWWANHLPVRPRALDLVDHQEPAALVADAAHFLQIFGADGVHAAFALDGLEEYRHHVRALARDALDGLRVIERHAHEA